MPSLTIEMDDAALTELGAQAERAKLDPEQLAARMLARQIYRLTGPARSRLPHKSQGNPDRAAERTARQLRVFDYVRRHGLPQGLKEKQLLAAQLGITYRTLYRDLAAAEQALSATPITRLRPPRRAAEAPTGT